MPSPMPLLLPLCLALARAVSALTPGSYVISNAQFPEQQVVGSNQTIEGLALGTFNLGGDPITSNQVWILDSSMTTLHCQLAGIFAMTDATFSAKGGPIGQGVFTVASPNPQLPLVNIGQQSWDFLQGSNGIFIVLSGQDLAWSLATDALFTQITLEPINPSDLRQQWIFTPTPLAPPP